jgi:LysR family transcriptional regulator for metE and metH
VARIPEAARPPRLELRDLRVVLALAAEGSTAGAGAVLHLTQSAVSRALLLAEDKLGVRLFERSARGLCPTPAGERLIAGAGPLLAQLAELEAAARRPERTRAPVRLVCECYTAYRWLPSALAQLRSHLPELTLKLAVEHTADPAAALAHGDIDVALLTTAATPAACRERPLFSDEIVFVLAPSHPLAQRPHLTARDLQATTLITSNTPPAERRWFMTRVFGRRRPKLDFMTLPLTEAIIDAARAGMGVAVLSEWIASTYLGGDDLLAKRFGAEPLRRPWRIAFHPSAADAATRLAGALEGLAPRVYPAAARSVRSHRRS